MNIIERNIFRLLRTGAFNVKEDIEPMSAFKWRRLYQMIVAQNLTPVFAQGVDIYKDDERLNLPADLWKKWLTVVTMIYRIEKHSETKT